jgi:hypothetical protein
MKISKIVEIMIKIMKELINSSGGCCGRDKNTISGHENSRIAKYSVMNILCANIVISWSIDVS